MSCPCPGSCSGRVAPIHRAAQRGESPLAARPTPGMPSEHSLIRCTFISKAGYGAYLGFSPRVYCLKSTMNVRGRGQSSNVPEVSALPTRSASPLSCMSIRSWATLAISVGLLVLLISDQYVSFLYVSMFLFIPGYPHPSVLPCDSTAFTRIPELNKMPCQPIIPKYLT